MTTRCDDDASRLVSSLRRREVRVQIRVRPRVGGQLVIRHGQAQVSRWPRRQGAPGGASSAAAFVDPGLAHQARHHRAPRVRSVPRVQRRLRLVHRSRRMLSKGARHTTRSRKRKCVQMCAHASRKDFTFPRKRNVPVQITKHWIKSAQTENSCILFSFSYSFTMTAIQRTSAVNIGVMTCRTRQLRRSPAGH